jgi:hypothetical protein
MTRNSVMAASFVKGDLVKFNALTSEPASRWCATENGDWCLLTIGELLIYVNANTYSSQPSGAHVCLSKFGTVLVLYQIEHV